MQRDIVIGLQVRRPGLNRSAFYCMTVIFPPLTFFTSYFGVVLKDITGLDSGFFWIIAGPISSSVILIVFALVSALSAMPVDEEKLTRGSKYDETYVTRLRLRAKGSNRSRNTHQSLSNPEGVPTYG